MGKPKPRAIKVPTSEHTVVMKVPAHVSDQQEPPRFIKVKVRSVKQRPRFIKVKTA